MSRNRKSDDWSRLGFPSGCSPPAWENKVSGEGVSDGIDLLYLSGRREVVGGSYRSPHRAATSKGLPTVWDSLIEAVSCRDAYGSTSVQP